MSDTYLLTAAQIEAMDGLAKTHFLNPNAKRINKSLGDATGLTGLGIHLIEVAPGDETTEYHVHHFEDEAVFVLSGTATATIGEEDHPIGPGDFIGYRKGGLGHTIVNTGSTTLKMMVIGQRLAHDVGDYQRLGKRIYRNPGLPWDVADHSDLSHPNAGPRTHHLPYQRSTHRSRVRPSAQKQLGSLRRLTWGQGAMCGLEEKGYFLAPAFG